jgi:hypothetical protein
MFTRANDIVYVGYKVVDDKPVAITQERESVEGAAQAIQAYALAQGLSARDIDFYVVRQTTSYAPLSKTRFTVSSTTEPVVGQ